MQLVRGCVFLELRIRRSSEVDGSRHWVIWTKHCTEVDKPLGPTAGDAESEGRPGGELDVFSGSCHMLCNELLA